MLKEHQSDNCVQPILTIAIPTYNRANYLDLCLSRFKEELNKLSVNERKLVKFYVSNNASTDNTDEVISRYLLIGAAEFEVINNSSNIGGESNVLQCYVSATTPYVWVFGDDDVILPNTLQNVLNILITKNVDILYLNHYWFKGDYTKNSTPRENLKVRIYTDALAFARRVNVMLTFISGQVVRSGVGDESLSTIVSQSNLPQLSWVLPLLRDGKYFIVLENDSLAAKGGNSGGYELVNVFGNNLKMITENILNDKPRVARAIQNGAILNFFPGLVISFRNGASKFSDKDMAIGLQRAFGDNWRYYVFIAPLIYMPLYFSRFYYYFVRLLAKLIGSFVI